MSKVSSILIGGDCGPAHGPADGFPVERYTELVGPVLEKADFRFVNCMRVFSSRGVYGEHARQVCQPTEMADIFSNGRFDAVTMANNHSYDAGPDAMRDTRALFTSRGIQVTGAGRDLAEARKPALIERDGVTVATYMKHLANELGAEGITVNCVAPALIDTPHRSSGAAYSEAQTESRKKLTPLGRMGTQEEVCGVVTFLASMQAGFITGSSISVEGGMHRASL